MSETAHIVQVNGTWLPGVSDYTVNSEDIHSSDSGRSDETGHAFVNRIREKVKKAHFVFKVTKQQASQIMGLIQPQTVQMMILVPGASGDYYTGDFYISKVSQQLITFYDKQYWLVKFNAVEY